MRQSRWMKLFSEYGFKAKYHLGKENVVVESWSRKNSEAKNEFWIDSHKVAWLGPTSVKRGREWFILAIEEAYTIKYSIHLKRMQLSVVLGFQIGGRVLKKNLASCVSKYLAYSRSGSFEYPGSFGLLQQPEYNPSRREKGKLKIFLTRLPRVSRWISAWV
ncbi:hypothetical protein Tco_1524198 [Tanacetum coccineum]